MTKKFASTIVSLMILGGCAATEASKEWSIFLRSGLTVETYSNDHVACDAYRAQEGATEGEKGGAVIAGLLLGGIIGAAATANAYDKSQARLFEECMFGKGYALIPLPEGLGPLSRDGFEEFDRRTIGMDLVAQKRADQLIAWNDAKNRGETKPLPGLKSTSTEVSFAPKSGVAPSAIYGSRTSSSEEGNLNLPADFDGRPVWAGTNWKLSDYNRDAKIRFDASGTRYIVNVIYNTYPVKCEGGVDAHGTLEETECDQFWQSRKTIRGTVYRIEYHNLGSSGGALFINNPLKDKIRLAVQSRGNSDSKNSSQRKPSPDFKKARTEASLAPKSGTASREETKKTPWSKKGRLNLPSNFDGRPVWAGTNWKLTDYGRDAKIRFDASGGRYFVDVIYSSGYVKCTGRVDGHGILEKSVCDQFWHSVKTISGTVYRIVYQNTEASGGALFINHPLKDKIALAAKSYRNKDVQKSDKTEPQPTFKRTSSGNDLTPKSGTTKRRASGESLTPRPSITSRKESDTKTPWSKKGILNLPADFDGRPVWAGTNWKLSDYNRDAKIRFDASGSRYVVDVIYHAGPVECAGAVDAHGHLEESECDHFWQLRKTIRGTVYRVEYHNLGVSGGALFINNPLKDKISLAAQSYTKKASR